MPYFGITGWDLSPTASGSQLIMYNLAITNRSNLCTNNRRNDSGWLPHRGKAQMICNYCFPTGRQSSPTATVYLINNALNIQHALATAKSLVHQLLPKVVRMIFGVIVFQPSGSEGSACCVANTHMYSVVICIVLLILPVDKQCRHSSYCSY